MTEFRWIKATRDMVTGEVEHYFAPDQHDVPTVWYPQHPMPGLAMDTNVPGAYEVPRQGPNRAQRRAAAKAQRRGRHS
jgi:hypothetical protein